MSDGDTFFFRKLEKIIYCGREGGVVNRPLGHEDVADPLEPELCGSDLGDLGSGDVEEHPEHFDGARASKVNRLGGPARAVDEEGVDVRESCGGGWGGSEDR